MKKAYIDLLLVATSVALAVYIVDAGLVHRALAAAGDGILFTSFVAGLFFTSFFTTPPAIAVLGELAQEGNLFFVVVVGAVGAVIGDYILFMFVRDRVAADAKELISGPKLKRFMRILKRGHFRRVLPVIGALIIASPLPDELGLALLGISSMRTRSFFILSFCMNALGILLIGLAARTLAF